MGNKHLIIAKQRLSFYGSPKDIESAIAIVENAGLTGEESKDRLLIQEVLKDEPCLKNNGVMYAGNTVYPYEPIVKEFRKLMKSRRLSSMTNRFYEFLHLNFDIAHYNKEGYINFYNDSFEELWTRLLCQKLNRIPRWRTDLIKIAEAIKEIKK